MKKLSDRILDVVCASARREFREEKRARLTNTTPTIIANNCVGGVIYHDLGLQFRSPVINLWFESDDFFEFLEHLEDYIRAVPEETKVEGISYPVGLLRRGDKQIRLYFTHYGSFEVARKKWVERAARVDLDNVYVIYEFDKPINMDHPRMKQFMDVKYRNKVMLASLHGSDVDSPNVVHMSCYDDGSYGGKILEYTNRFTQRRHLDEFDYVSFLNQK